MKQVFLCFLFLTVASIYATSQNTINLVLKTGSVCSFVLTDKPFLTYSSDTLLIKTEKTAIEYPLSELEKITFSDTENAVESISLSEDTSITIYDLNGKVVKSLDKSSDSDGALPINDLPTGIYIVRQGNINYKIIKQ